MDMERLALAGLDDRGDLVAWDGPDRMDRGTHHHRPVACTAPRQLLTERRDPLLPGVARAVRAPGLDTSGGPAVAVWVDPRPAAAGVQPQSGHASCRERARQHGQTPAAAVLLTKQPA